MQYQWAEHQIFPAGEGAILFGVEQGSLFYIDAETKGAVSRWRSGPSADPSGLDQTGREILQGLKEIGILLPAGRATRRPRFVPDPARVPLQTMVLEVAQDCNLRCRYCYAEGGAYGKSARLLTPENARRAVQKLVQEAPEREKATLILFGGEPLLNMPAVEAAVEEVERLTEGTGKEVFVSLTTNGTLLTPEIVSFLKGHRIAVSVSMDGPEELHDANRAGKNGEGSYARAVAQLPALLDGARSAVAARVTLAPEQWGRVEEVFDHLLGLGFHEVGIAAASPIHPGLLPDRAQEEALLSGFSSLARRFVKGASAGKVLPFSNLIDLLARLHVGQTKSVSCGAGLGYLAVDAGGDFYLCHRLTGDDDFLVGSLDEGADHGRISSALEQVGTGLEELCRDCWARTLCSGGCHYENHLRGKRLGLPPGSSCRFILAWLQLGIESYAELKRNGAEEFLRMLDKRAKC